jgi:hypothetical protein
LIAWLTSGREPTPAPQPVAPTPRTAEPEPEPEPEVAAEPEPAAALGAEPVEPPAPTAAGAAPAPAPEDTDAGASRAELVRHGRLMIPAALLNAIEQNSVEHARAMRDQLQAKRSEGYLSDSEFEMLDLVIDCLEHVSDARDEARDVLQFGAPSILSEPLKRACLENR